MFASSGEMTPPCGVPATGSPSPPRPPSPLPAATAAAASAPAGPRSAAPPASAACRGRCCRSSRGCRHPARGCRPRAQSPERLQRLRARSASAETHTTTAGSPPRKSAPAPASPPSAPPGLGPSECPSGRLPPSAFGMYPPQDRPRPIRACAQPSPELLQEALDAVLLDRAERHPIDARRALVPSAPASTPPAGRHPCRSGRTARGNGVPGTAWPRPRAGVAVGALCRSALAHRGSWTGLAGHALALTRSIDVTTAGALPSRRVVRSSRLRSVRYYDPLGLPLRTPRFHHRLIRARLPRPGPRRRASRVPHLSLHACCAPYPAETSATLPDWRRRHGLRRDMSGSALGL